MAGEVGAPCRSSSTLQSVLFPGLNCLTSKNRALHFEFVSRGSIESFNEAILRETPWLNVIDLYAMGLSTIVQGVSEKLGGIIHQDYLEGFTFGLQAVEDSVDPLRPQGGINLHRSHFPREGRVRTCRFIQRGSLSLRCR